MKLATLHNGSPDGQLLVVARDLKTAVAVSDVSPTLQAALEQWSRVEVILRSVYAALNVGVANGAFALDMTALDAPLPRAWQWLDGSAFENHGELMQKAFNLPPIETKLPLMYQGMSHRFLAAHADVALPSEADGIDFEGEFGIITDAVPMGVTPDQALTHIKLCVLINDWSLRAIAPIEMKTGFGWVQAKPACSLGPVCVTPDELGPDWRDGRLQAVMLAKLNGQVFGEVPASHMAFGFHELIAHAARTRDLCAGTIIGSGTVSSPAYAEVGSCCIAERRAIEMIAMGKPQTPFLSFGDRVTVSARVSGHDVSPFGSTDQIVKRAEIAA